MWERERELEERESGGEIASMGRGVRVEREGEGERMGE